MCHTNPMEDLHMATMNVSLPDPMKEWVEAQSQTGRYSNASDYVRDLIRRDQERNDKMRICRRWWRKAAPVVSAPVPKKIFSTMHWPVFRPALRAALRAGTPPPNEHPPDAIRRRRHQINCRKLALRCSVQVRRRPITMHFTQYLIC